MNRKYRATAASIALVALALLAISALATPVAAQSTVSIDGPDDPVDADGDFDFTVTMTDSGVGEVAVESSDFDVDLSVVDADGSSIGGQTDTSVEFIDIEGGDSTYTLNADITGGSGGNTGTITAATGGNIDDPGVDDQQSVDFSITDTAPEFSVSNLNPVNADVTEGEIITVSADIENTGDAAGSANVDLTLDGSVADSTTTGELAPGESQTVSFSVDTGNVGTGSFTHGIQTADDSQTGSLTISQDPAGIRGQDRSGSVFAPGDVDDVFQGEDIEFTQTLSGIPDGGASGEVLEDGPIPADQDTGIYAAGGNPNNPTVTVRQPRVQTLEVVNTNGEDVTEVTENQPVLIGVDFNYEEAEPIQNEIFDNADIDIFNDVNGQADFGDLTPEQEDELGNYDARYAVSFDNAGDYEITISPDGDGDVDQVDSATRSEVLSVVSDEDAELELESDTATQGQEIDFEITNAEDGDIYYVGLEVGDDRFADPIEQGNVDPADRRLFRNVGDTEDIGVTGSPPSTDDYYWAELEIDGTSATGRIDTQLLDDTSVDIELLEQGATPEDPELGFGEGEELDEVTLEVEEAEIGIDSPPATYVPGMEVDLTGSVSEGVEAVDIFVRDRDNYFHVTGDVVETENSQYEIEDFDLANEARTLDAQDIVGQPGVYRYGVIDREDVFLAQLDDDSNTDGPPGAGLNGAAYAQSGDTTPGQSDATGIRDIANAGDAGLDSSDFNSGASTQQSIRVAEPSLEASFRTFDGQVYQPDGIDVSGELIGPRDYVIMFTDSRGTTALDDFTSDSDNGEIDEEDIDLIDDLSVGTVRGAVLSPGRDGTFGDGSFSVSQEIVDQLIASGRLPAGTESPLTASVDNFIRIAEAAGQQGYTQSQVQDLLLSETIEDAASDDLIVSEEFRLSDDSRTEMTDAVPAQHRDQLTGVHPIEVGETMVVRGITNRDFEDATIVVEADDGPSIAELGTEVTEEWDTDGVWEVEFEVSEDVEPGEYVMRSDDGERIDEMTVEILAEGTLEDGERLQNEAEQLRQQVEELQGELETVRGERDDLEQQVSELESTNSDLEDRIAELEENQQPEDDSEDDSEEPEEEEGQPGFTAVAALVALVAVALLALRRREE
ncbi:MAG: PGF-CTERM sorting domain-containing protein [Halobacteriales archaeon]|nr:PGF-CTERM sorting domain-containing protein [Halobacteriales archaeon]